MGRLCLGNGDPFTVLFDNFGYNVDEFIDKFGALLGRERFPVVLDGDDHLADGFWQPFADVLYEVGPNEFDRIEVVTARRTFHPIDAGRFEKLLRQFGRMFGIVVLMKPMPGRKVLRYERHHIFEQYFQIHGGGECAVEYLKWRGALAAYGAPQMQRRLLSRLIGIGRLSFELIQRGQEWLERRFADEYVLVEMVRLILRAPLNARLTVIVSQHRLAAHASVDEAVLFTIVAGFFGRRRFELFAVQILLYVAVRDFFVRTAHHVYALYDFFYRFAVAAVVVDEFLDRHRQATPQLFMVGFFSL